MERRELTALLPKHRDDEDGARAIVALGYPTLEPVLRSLFPWLATSGSPVELVLRPFFAQLGAPALPLVREALEARTQPALKDCLLHHILPAWPRATVAELEPQIVRILGGNDGHGLDVLALRLLWVHGLGRSLHVSLEEWRNHKLAFLRDRLALLEGLDAAAGRDRATCPLVTPEQAQPSPGPIASPSFANAGG